MKERLNFETMEPSVDVIIPTHNETVRLLRAVESALAQTFKPRSVIIVDDGSSDEVRSFIASCPQMSYPGVQVILSEHAGHPGVMRRIGIESSSADWVAFLDADDVWYSHKLQKQMSHALTLGVQAVCSNAAVVERADAAPLKLSVPNETGFISTRQLLMKNLVVNSSVIAWRQSLMGIGTYVDRVDCRGVEDYATWLRLSVDCKFFYDSEELLSYENSEGSLSKTASPNRSPAISDFNSWIAGKVPVGFGEYIRYSQLKMSSRAQWIFARYLELLVVLKNGIQSAFCRQLSRIKGIGKPRSL